jgi:hypothetical protein
MDVSLRHKEQDIPLLFYENIESYSSVKLFSHYISSSVSSPLQASNSFPYILVAEVEQFMPSPSHRMC